jgi:hypothetical protein
MKRKDRYGLCASLRSQRPKKWFNGEGNSFGLLLQNEALSLQGFSFLKMLKLVRRDKQPVYLL